MSLDRGWARIAGWAPGLGGATVAAGPLLAAGRRGHYRSGPRPRFD